MKLKILMINPMDESYGSTHRLIKFYQYLLLKGWEIIYVEPNRTGSKSLLSFLQPNNAVGFLYGTIRRTIMALTMTYDILYIQTITPLTISSIFVARLRGKKVVVDWDDLSWVLQKNTIRMALVRFCEHALLRYPHVVFVPNRYLLQYAQAHGARRVYFVPHGVDFDIFDPGRHRSVTLKQDLGLPNLPTVGYLASFTTGGIGDLDFIFSAIKRTNQIRWDIHFLIIGGGPQFLSCRQLATDMELTNIHFTGLLPQRDVPKYIQCLDIAIIFMRDNIQNKMKTSMKIGEYLAMKKIVVGHLAGQTKDDFAQFCITCDPTVDCLVEAILDTLQNPIGSGDTRTILMKTYNWQRSADIVDEKLRAL